MKMTREEAKAKIGDGLKRLNEALAEGRSGDLERYLKTMGRFHRYSFNNIMLILIQNPDATHVAGFHAWKKFGRKVKKGESGIAIVAPCRYKKKVENEAGEQETGYALRGFTVAYVFDVEQTEGDELPEFTAVNGEPGDALERIKAYIDELGIELVYHSSLGPSCLGTSAGGTINVLHGLEPAVEFSVLAHEIAHEDLHHGERRQETTKTIRETEAEAVAAVVCSAFGVDSTARSSDYISLYRGTTDTLGESLQFIQKTAEKIIEGISAIDADAVESTVKGDSEAAQVHDAEVKSLRTGRADFEERQAERIERYHDLADKRGREANATHQEARRMAGAIPFGQPILVGHHSERRDRKYRDRMPLRGKPGIEPGSALL
jgi:antirestriction protein ArdC